MVEQLSKRTQLLSLLILTWAMFSGPLQWVSGSGFKKAAFQDVLTLKEPGDAGWVITGFWGSQPPFFVVPPLAF